MCERCTERRKAWKGWRELPARPPATGRGPWLDLSFPLTPTLSRAALFPEPRFRRILSMPERPVNVTEIQMVVHFGTHVDAPSHFISDGPDAEAIPVERLSGEAVVWHLEVEADGLIDARDLEAARPTMREGDIVIVDTGWSAHVGTERYHHHPSLTPEAADWLVGHGCKLLAVDVISPDMPGHRRPPDFDWPVHHALLGNGVLVSELLNPPPALRGRRAEVVFAPLPIVGSDGAPARVLARPLD